MGSKQRVEDLPKGRFEKWGYGLARVRHDEWQPRIDAVTTALAIIEGKTPASKTPDIINSLEIAMGLFARQYLGDQYDWFTTAKFTAYPSPQIAQKIAQGFAKIRGSLFNDDARGVREGREELQKCFAPEMLTNYLDMAVRAEYPVPEVGFAFIVFSTSEKQLLHIGTTEGQVEDVLKRLGNDYEGHDPYGVAVAYLVNDPEAAGELLKKALKRHYVEDGFYRIDLKTARERVEEVLYKADEIVHSPWHAEGEELEIEQEESIKRKVA